MFTPVSIGPRCAAAADLHAPGAGGSPSDARLAALDRRGTMTSADVAAPTIQLAENGSPTDDLMPDVPVHLKRPGAGALKGSTVRATACVIYPPLQAASNHSNVVDATPTSGYSRADSLCHPVRTDPSR
jgi:hypothetical protein